MIPIIKFLFNYTYTIYYTIFYTIYTLNYIPKEKNTFVLKNKQNIILFIILLFILFKWFSIV